MCVYMCSSVNVCFYVFVSECVYMCVRQWKKSIK